MNKRGGSRNSWRDYDSGLNEEELVNEEEAGASGKMGKNLKIKMMRYAKHDKIASMHEGFLGALTKSQIGVFLFLVALWATFNIVNFVTMIKRLTDTDSNTKVLTSTEGLAQNFLKFPIGSDGYIDKTGSALAFKEQVPRVVLGVCSQDIRYTEDLFTPMNATTLKYGTESFDSETIEAKGAICRTFRTKTVLNAYNPYQTQCCGMEIPRSMLLGKVKAKSSDSDSDATVLKDIRKEALAELVIQSKTTNLLGSFLKIVPGDDTTPTEELLDPISFEKPGSRALFNDIIKCHPTENQTIAEGKEFLSYSAVKLVRKYDDRSLIKAFRDTFYGKPVPTYQGSLRILQDKKALRRELLPCGPGGQATSSKVTWAFQFLSQFQEKEMKKIIMKNNQELLDGLGSFFGLFTTSMVIWAFFFPKKPELDPGVRKTHQCFASLCPSWGAISTSDEDEVKSDNVTIELK
jgi:hypothetical protein